MKEFKFVRGVYTNKPLFNDIKDESLFILDEKDRDIGLDLIDDVATQKLLVEASDNNRECKLYAITPKQITMEGNLVRGESGNSYKFTVKDVCVSDLAETVPSNVKTKAKNLIESCLSTTYSLTTNDIGIADSGNPINVYFRYNEKPFVKSMIFRVTGEVYQLFFKNLNGVLAQDKAVYTLGNNTYNIHNNLSGSYFENGQKFSKRNAESRTTVLSELTIDVSSLVPGIPTQIRTIAETYTLPEGYYFKDFRSSEIFYSVSHTDKRLLYVYNSVGAVVGTILLSEESTHLREQNVNDTMYIIKNGQLVKLENYYPNKTETLNVYIIKSNEQYKFYKDSVYIKDSENFIYKELSEKKTVNVDRSLVTMQDTVTLSPIHRADCFIEIDPNKVGITATEV